MRKVIRRRIRSQSDGINVAGDIQGVIAANIAKPGGTTRTSTTSHVRVVQNGGETEVTESHSEHGESA